MRRVVLIGALIGALAFPGTAAAHPWQERKNEVVRQHDLDHVQELVSADEPLSRAIVNALERRERILERERKEWAANEAAARAAEQAAITAAEATASSSYSSTPASGSIWDQLALCEAGGNWAENAGTIYDGGLQFHPDTWLAYGGGEFAPEAWQASREQQIVIAERVLAGQGWGAWPGCAAKLGLL